MKKLLILAVLIASAMLPLPSLHLTSSIRQAEAAQMPSPSGATVPSPLNYDFTAGEIVVASPTNYGFEDGLNNWTLSGSNQSYVSAPNGGYSGKYLRFENGGTSGPYVDSTAFTVQSSAPIWTFYLQMYGSGGIGQIYLSTQGGGYTNWTQIYSSSGATSGWDEKSADLTSYVGVSVKIRYRALFGTVGFDEGATRRIPSWTVTAGKPYVDPSVSYPATTASAGDYDVGGDGHCKGSSIPGRISAGATLKGNESIKSDVFTITPDSSRAGFLVVADGIGPAFSVYLYLDSDNYTSAHIIYNKQYSSGTTGISTYCDLSAWSGHNAKLILASSWGGDLSIGVAGLANFSLGGKFPDNSQDPVSLTMGAVSHVHTDVAIPSKGVPLEFTRSYSSAASLTQGSLGWGWRDNYESALSILTSGDVDVQYPDGGHAFFKNNSGALTPPQGVFDSLLKNGDNTYTLTTTAQLKYNYDTSGRFTSIVDRNGNTTSLSYNSLGQLSTVTDPGGRQLTFAYESGSSAINTPTPALVFTNSDFESGNWTNWTPSGTAFGSAPASASGTGKQGTYFGSSYYNGGTASDSYTGTLLSQTFTAGKQLVLLLNGGTASTTYVSLVLSDQSEVLKTSNETNSNSFRYITLDTSAYEGQTVQLKLSDQNTGSWGHIGIDYVQIVNSASGTYAPPQGQPITPFYNGDFEQASWANWFMTGNAFGGARPATDKAVNRQDDYYAKSTVSGTGTLTSSPFTAGNRLTFTISGGNYPNTAYAALVLSDGSEVLKTTGAGSGDLQAVTWDTRQYAGQTVKVRLVDNETGTNGYIGADDVRVIYNSRLKTVTDPLSRTVTFSYDDTTSDLTSVQDVKGGTTTYTYSNHRLATLTDSLSHLQVTNTYDETNRVAEQQDAMNGVTCFYYGVGPTYTSSNCGGVSPAPVAGQTIMVDQRGIKETHQFDLSFRPTAVQDALGGVSLLTYEASGALCSPANNGNLCSTTDPSDHVTSVTYDSSGNVLTTTNGLRQPVGTAESGSQCGSAGTGNGVDDDSDGTKDDGCPSVVYTYTSKNDVDLATDSRGNQTDYIYDSSGNLTRTAGKDGSSNVKALTCYERDSAGLVTATVQSTDLTIPSGVTDQCTGDRTQIGYDSYGDQTCLVDARFSSTSQSCSQIATKTTYTYDSGGRVLSATNELRQPVGTAESGSQCGSSGTGNGVDDDSDGTKDDGCPSVIYTYDNQNNVLTTTDGVGDVTSQAYNAKGMRTSITDGNRQPVGTAESGSQCGSAGTGNGTDDDSDGTKDDGCPSLILTYDAAGRLTSTTDSLGNKTTYGYDADGNKTSVTNPNRQPVGTAESGSQCGSSGTGNGVDDDSDGTKDDGCPSAKYAYDALNRLTSETDALGHVTSYAYNADSTLQQKTDARSLVTKYFPDAAQQLGVMEFWNGSTLVSSVDYYYDDAGNRTSMVDVTGTTSYQYDALDRVTSVTSPGSSTVGYTYDDLPGGSAADYPGQRTKITYPDSKTASYTYKADGRMETVTDWLSKTTTYSYDNAGELTHTVLGNSVTTDNTYDDAGRPTNLVNKDGGGSTLSSYAYTLDKVGNRTQVVDTNGTTTVGYDAGYQVTAVTYPNSDSQSFTYDPMGNRLSTTFNSSTTNYTYDAADEMTGAGATSYGYDADGNQTGRGSDTFGYDHQNRLTSTSLGGTSGSYAYNGDGVRTSRTLGGSTVSYSWDQAAALPQLLQDSAGNTYVYGLDLISKTDSGGSQQYYLCDGLGSTTGLTDGSGNVVGTYQYDVYGAIRSQSGGSGNEFTFTGEQNDPTGLEYLRARYYDPGTGRFLGEDPLGLLQRYPYVTNSPVNSTDPRGLCKWYLACADEIPVPPPPVAPFGLTGTVIGCAVSSECRSDVADWAQTVADHPSSVIQESLGAGIAIFSSGDIHREGGVTFYENCWGACWLFKVVPRAHIITVGHYVFGRGPISASDECHELVHVRQGDKYGLTWLPRYFWEARHGYFNNRFEQEAFNAEKACTGKE